MATPQEDAIARLLAQQAAATGSLANSAAATNAPAGALAAVQSLPQSMSQTLQAQQQARTASEAERSAAVNAASQAGVAQLVASIGETGKLQSNMDALRQQWSQADLASKMNLAQEQGKNRLSEIEALRQKEAEEAMYRSQEHAYRMSRAGGRGDGLTPYQQAQLELSGARYGLDLEKWQTEQDASQREALGGTQQAIWGEYATLRDSGVPAGDAWRKTLGKYDALGADPISRQLQDYVRQNAQVNYDAQANQKPSIFDWGAQAEKVRKSPKKGFWSPKF